MIDPQGRANEIRDRLADSATLDRLGVEVLRAMGEPDHLTIRARHRDHVVTVERHGNWTADPPEELSLQLTHELVAEALGTRRTEPTLRWRPGPAPTGMTGP